MALKCILASMDGMTSAAFRSICFEYGADGATTEMIPAPGFARSKRKRCSALETLTLRREEEGELAAQIIGGEPKLMAAAAERLQALERFELIEINMGCPARKVVGSGNGSALLLDLKRAEEILRAVCVSVDLPVRLKMRLGWDEEHIVAPQLARIAQDAGCAQIIVHGRTRSQQYAGEVDLENMCRVREATDLPFYANGAVTCARDAAAFAAATGADGVCIGRAALKNPWIFEDIHALERGEAIAERTAQERIALLLKFADRLCEQKPEHFAIQEMRKYCLWYLDGITGAESVFERVKVTESLADFHAVYEAYLDRLIQTGDVYVRPEYQMPNTLDTVRR